MPSRYWRRNRGRLEMIADVVEACVYPALKTHILYRANTNAKRVEWYLDVLIAGGFLVQRDDQYEATTEGLRFVQRFRKLLATLPPAVIGREAWYSKRLKGGGTV